MLQATDAVKLFEEANKEPDYSAVNVDKFLNKLEGYITSWAKSGIRQGKVMLKLDRVDCDKQAGAILFRLEEAGYKATYTYPKSMGDDRFNYTFSISF